MGSGSEKGRVELNWPAGKSHHQYGVTDSANVRRIGDMGGAEKAYCQSVANKNDGMAVIDVHNKLRKPGRIKAPLMRKQLHTCCPYFIDLCCCQESTSRSKCA